jgi:hypothetical protein
MPRQELTSYRACSCSPVSTTCCCRHATAHVEEHRKRGKRSHAGCKKNKLEYHVRPTTTRSEAANGERSSAAAQPANKGADTNGQLREVAAGAQQAFRRLAEASMHGQSQGERRQLARSKTNGWTALTANVTEWYFTVTGHSFTAILQSGELSVNMFIF